MSESRREKQDGEAAPPAKKPAGKLMSRNVTAGPKGAAAAAQKGPKAARGPVANTTKKAQPRPKK
jgi:hypothetical protein